MECFRLYEEKLQSGGSGAFLFMMIGLLMSYYFGFWKWQVLENFVNITNFRLIWLMILK